MAARHPALADVHGTMFSATFNPARSREAIRRHRPYACGTAGAGRRTETVAAFRSEKDAHRLRRQSRTTAVESPNIVAKLEGSDPVLKNEYVLVSAHLDHLGIGAPINGKTIYRRSDGRRVRALPPSSRSPRASVGTRERPETLHALRHFHGRGERPARFALLRRTSHRSPRRLSWPI